MFQIREGILVDHLETPVTASTLGLLTQIKGGHRDGDSGPCVVMPEAQSPVLSLSILDVVIGSIMFATMTDGGTTFIMKARDRGRTIYVAFDMTNGSLPHPRWVEIIENWKLFGKGYHVRMFPSTDAAMAEVTRAGAPVSIARDKIKLKF